ncbi:pyruvate dehydrogenase complex E1 component subunit beta [Cyclobacterium amurskyense]|jgi:pyruvate dehydrogenase E1 component beta subunit|uniref:Pyruvate dehydrogenase E1 component beta subunit n=1 Tax=Cyclobacterium amurskyense TaxID=320787 RepID=A0A0H4P9M2_9BACT|nr:pyruvate dehydrogenase complex E1 component subunit beta [Cyclobacterium amurskyense]AKP49835.1 Pyruvate dehydrogenase E1 component beta subunit [Cyclobacterium amurskyense]|tara:strand:- start:58 stop:1038 length:981 start_codon:yes stop_codon:yes gene_type:complete
MKEIQFRDAIRDAMSEEMRRDKNVFLMGEEVAEYNGAYKASQGMLDEFGPERVFDTPISELGFSGLGVGAAMNGLRPIIEFMTFNFSLVAMDQLVNSAAKMLAMSGGQYSVPIVFRGPTGNAGQLGATHSSNFENWFANTPGLKVVVPSNPYDAKGLLKASIRDNNPVIFMESEVMYSDKGEVPEGEYLLPIGVAEIKRKGDDVTIVSFGKMMKVAYEAADELAKDNIHAEVIDLRTVKPIDYPTVIASVKKTNRCVIVEEANPVAGLSSDIAYNIQKQAFDYLDAPVIRVNSMDIPLSYSPAYIEVTLPNVKRTIDAVKSVTYKK